MQQERDEVLKEYRQAGLVRSKDFKEPEDHIAIELEFMAYLCRKASESFQTEDMAISLEYLRKQKDFLEKHLLVWVPSFCKDLEQAAESGFYKGIAQLTAEFINAEQETIAALIDEFQEQ